MLENSVSVQSPGTLYPSSEIYILDPQLTDRVNQRAPAPDVAADIIQRLKTRGLFSAELCETIRDEPEQAGFNAKEADMLLLDDEKWKSKSEWLEHFIQSLPTVLQDPRITHGLKRLVHKATHINSIDDLKKNCENLEDLHFPVKCFLKTTSTVKDCDRDAGTDGPALEVPQTYLAISENCNFSDEQEISAVEMQDGALEDVDHYPRSETQAASALVEMSRGPSVLRFDRLCHLQNTVNDLLFNSPSNVEGFPGNLQPTPLARFLVDGHTLMIREHGSRAADLIDLGCGPGHPLWCAVLSGLFKVVQGVDLPKNQKNLQNAVQQFVKKAGSHQNLAQYVSQFQNVQFHWIDCGNDRNGCLDALLRGSAPHSVMIYWFCTGWDFASIEETAKIISQSPFVHCVACLPRDKGRNGCDILEALNSAPGQKRFFLSKKRSGIAMSGKGSFTGYFFVRSAVFEYEKPSRPQLVKGQPVDVFFNNPLRWLRGEIISVRSDASNKGRIKFDDGEYIEFEDGDPDVHVCPTEDNQWRSTSGDAACMAPGQIPQAQSSFCVLCSEALASRESRRCDRCHETAYHVECLGGNPQVFVCPYCRAALAEIGRSQFPNFVFSPDHSSTLSCFSCGDPIQDTEQYSKCQDCNHLWGHCCSSRTSGMTVLYRCPGCIGISAHDAVLKESLQPIAASVVDLIAKKPPSSRKNRPSEEEIRLCDEYASAVISLQDSCQWAVHDDHIGGFVHVARFQVDWDTDPSAGPFHLLNILGRKGGPDLSLVLKVTNVYGKHCLQRARTQNRPKPGKCSKKGKSPETDLEPQSEPKAQILAEREPLEVGIKMIYATADMRNTPWWQLMKVALVNLATSNTLVIFSRPPVDLVDLGDDPYFKVLRQLSTIVNIEEGYSDSEMADLIRKYNPDVLIDAGGPTLGSFGGVMGLLNDILRGAHLGYPGTGCNVDFTIADPYVLPQGSLQAETAPEALMWMRCYQPNDSFSCSVPIESVEPAPVTTRSYWNLPDDAFVFAFFCRNGRISPEQSKTFVNIAKRAPDCRIWLRKTSTVAVLRIKALFQKAGIDSDRIIFSSDTPSHVHRERIDKADIVLDSVDYCGHTTCSDALTKGVPYLALQGPYFQSRVSYSLVMNMKGDNLDKLLCTDLQQFEDRAVYFATDGRAELGVIREEIRLNVALRLGICDGESWTREYQMGLEEVVSIRKNNPTVKIPDIFCSEQIINTGPTNRKFIVLHRREKELKDGGMDIEGIQLSGLDAERGTPADSVISAGAPCAILDSSHALQGVEAAKKRKNGSERRSDDIGAKKICIDFQSCAAHSPASSADISADESDECEPEIGGTPDAKAERHRIPWLFDLALKDPREARLQAHKFLEPTMPPGRKIMWVWDDVRKEKMPAIQVPCFKRRVMHDSGNDRKKREMPLCYVSEPVEGVGSALYCGQTFETGMYMTQYDGKLVLDSEVDDKTYVISINYGLNAIDSGKTPNCELVKNSALGCKANHAGKDRTVKYLRNYSERSLIAGCNQAIYLVAVVSGIPHTELLGHYTAGAAERDHGIPRVVVKEGKDSIPERERGKAPKLVLDAIEVLRKDAGLDLLTIRGQGSEGAVVEVQSGRSQPFVVKISIQQYDIAKRLGGLSAAALMHRATKHPNIISMKLNTEIGWSSALIKASGQYVAAVAMDCADTDAHAMWAEFQKRFKNLGDSGLLPDLKSVWKGTIQVADWMHGFGMAHGDIKPSNVLLKRLETTPDNQHVAFCVVSGTIYQIVFGDLGHARWSGQAVDAVHVFADKTRGGRGHSLSMDFPRGKCVNGVGKNIVPVNTRECSKAFGHLAKIEQVLEHPGLGTVTIRAPHYDRCFQAGQGKDQRRFDQSADMWALGVMGLRILAPTISDKSKKRPEEDWAQGLRIASDNAEKWLRLSNRDVDTLGASRRGVQSLLGVLDPRDCGSWIVRMVREKYSGDSWPLLSDRMSGHEKGAWMSLLDLLEGLLRYSSEHRLTANRALEHRFFSAPSTAP